MDLFGASVLFVMTGLLIYFVIIYNGLVRITRNIDKAWANIDVLLKQRHDEIPKLVDICKAYMKHERETLTELTEARAACARAQGVADSGRKEGTLTATLSHLFAVAESYPDLKANQVFMRLQERLSELEDRIADRREFYNDSVNTYNVRINQIPDLFVARMLALKNRSFFRITAADRQIPAISLEP